MDYADRRLQKSQKELSAIKRGLGRAGGDQKKMTKELKKIRKYFRSPLAEVARLDDSIYNVRKPSQGSINGDKRSEDQGNDPSNREPS
jgi:septal ring factor EnvC (AmiA/AmiB activator)|tara:strand:+ start:5277 stop:5540 length:264 start_codon:yes stop_codon:yes gene_type:complete